MKDQNNTKRQLIDELVQMRQRIAQLESVNAERRQAEVQQQEKYARALLHSIHEDILVIDGEYRITDANNTFLRTTGHKREEVIGCHCYEVSHAYNRPCDELGEECLLREVFKTGKPRNCRHEHTRGDGSKIWVDILLSPTALLDRKGE